jgi:hypothetical protein
MSGDKDLLVWYSSGTVSGRSILCGAMGEMYLTLGAKAKTRRGWGTRVEFALFHVPESVK